MQKMKIKEVLRLLKAGHVTAIVLPPKCEDIEVTVVGFFKPSDEEGQELSVELSCEKLTDKQVICLAEHYVGAIPNKIGN